LSRQRFRLDRRRALSYIAASALVAACAHRLAPLVPVPLAPAERAEALAWSRATSPAHHTAIRFRWRYRDERRRWAGRGTTRIAPPDSLRFDYAGALGLGAGAAVVVGDSVLWADPEEHFRSLVPAVRMLWAALGVARAPAADAVVFGRREREGDREVSIWRFVEGGDTLDYLVTQGSSKVLQAEWRQDGKVVARSETHYDQAMPATARIDFPEARARFEFTVVAVDTAAVIPPALWRSRR
jgi:hypothetical protein